MADELLERFLSFSNMMSAYERVVLKGKGAGVDRVSPDMLRKDIERTLIALSERIREHRYVPEPVLAVTIAKEAKPGETREIGISTVLDKIVQTALLQVLEPLTEKIFVSFSYGYRPRRGPVRAVRRVEHHLRYESKVWAFRRDINNFFDNVNHERLLQTFSHFVSNDPAILELVALWCKAGIIDRGGEWRNVMAGVRQGHVISPLLANIYLHPFDLYMAGQGITVVRYADDYVIMAKSRDEATAGDESASKFLFERLSLTVKGGLGCLDTGFAFLGIRFHRDGRTIDEIKFRNMKQKISDFFASVNGAPPGVVLKDLAEMSSAWARYYKFIDPRTQFSALDDMIRNSISQLIVEKIGKKEWPERPPQDVILPVLASDISEGTKESSLGEVWRQASRTARRVAEARNGAERKSAKKRFSFARDHASDGEMIVTTPGHFVGKRGGRVVVREKQRIVAELPVTRLKGLVVGLRGIAISSDLIGLCLGQGIPVQFIDPHGKIAAVAVSPDDMNRDVVLNQARAKDSAVGLALARSFILGKVKNQHATMKYFGKYKNRRRSEFCEAFQSREEEMQALVEKIARHPLAEAATFRQTLLGLEGAFAIIYWRLVAELVRGRVEFPGRVREGASDLLNAALNYGYGILYSRVLDAIVRAKLNPAIGFLHAPQPGKPVLSYDMVEEFRSAVVDRAVIALINNGVELTQGSDGLLESDSKKKVSFAVLTGLARKALFHGRALTVEEVIREQACNVAKSISGNATYRPFLAKW